ncbi:hypothetical protein GCM10023193_15480 [Planotetraspora kaengkrachanensis]|uniref:Uncharacterized protein n=1 Tax=Planotetraspora kaengkrachanensis TaxID=575193 RepID=A0A8J3LSQ5_9ACTN|nr:hypothetical protein Pka01_11990 [Planotetraspora kaengkrachanensis]
MSRWATDHAETPWGSAGQMNQTARGAPPIIGPESSEEGFTLAPGSHAWATMPPKILGRVFPPLSGSG